MTGYGGWLTPHHPLMGVINFESVKCHNTSNLRIKFELIRSNRLENVIYFEIFNNTLDCCNSPVVQL